jgi:hypothetical protein
MVLVLDDNVVKGEQPALTFAKNEAVPLEAVPLALVDAVFNEENLDLFVANGSLLLHDDYDYDEDFSDAFGEVLNYEIHPPTSPTPPTPPTTPISTIPPAQDTKEKDTKE